MTVAIVFGNTPVDITPKGFAAMAGHVKSELCRLLLDRGFNVAWISLSCGISPTDVVHLSTMRHRFVLGSDLGLPAGTPPPEPVSDPSEKQQNAIMERLNTQCCRLLVRMPASGVKIWKNSAELERDIGIRAGNGMRVVNALYEQRLIERRRAPRGFEQAWQLTEMGSKLRGSMDESDLPTIVEPQQ